MGLHFSIDKSVLSKALKVVSGIASKKQTDMPILKNIVIQILEDDTANFLATDLDRACIVNYPILSHSGIGEISIEAEKLSDIVTTLKDTISFTVNESDNNVSIKSGRSTFKIATMDTSSFPNIQDFAINIKNKSSFTISSTALKTSIELNSICLGKDDYLGALSGIFLEMNPDDSIDNVRLTTTDGKRLESVNTTVGNLSIYVPPDDEEVSDNKIIPGKGLLELKRILPIADTPVDVIVGIGSISFSFEKTVYALRLLDGDYPDYRMIIPEGFEFDAVFDRNEIMLELTRMEAATVGESPMTRVVVNGQTNKAVFNTLNTDSKLSAESEIDCTVVGDIPTCCISGYQKYEFPIAIRAAYIVETMQRLTSESVTIRFVGTLMPIMIIDQSHTNILSIVMPCRLPVS